MILGINRIAPKQRAECKSQPVVGPGYSSQNLLRLWSSFSVASQCDLFINQPKRNMNHLAKPGRQLAIGTEQELSQELL